MKMEYKTPRRGATEVWESPQLRAAYRENDTASLASLAITRISDGKVLIDFKDDDIDMWRHGTSYIRSKFGIYRSLAGGKLNQTPVGQSPLLKNESLWLSDFRVYEKNSNANPGTPHE
jgi:hypothetical protein